jgi:lysine-specific histone demethylase 1
MSSNSSLNANLNQRFPDPAVDLGAQIVTGFDNGNPLAAIVKRQLRLRWHNLHDDSLLFNDTDGRRVDRTQDVRAERLFNDILDRASSLKDRSREQTLIEGDRELIDQGKEPHGESGRQIAKVEENEAIIPPMPPSPPLSSRETPLSHQSHHASGRGTLTRHQVPARRALMKLGFDLRDDDSKSKDNDRDNSNIHDTLGDTMRSILLDIQSLVDLSPMDLKLLNWHWANLEYGNATNLNKLSLKYWDQDDGNELDLGNPFSSVGF